MVPLVRRFHSAQCTGVNGSMDSKKGVAHSPSKNGESFAGVFHRDRISSSRETDEEEREVFPRPKTPLGTLIGDVAGGEKGADSGRFSVSISPLLSPLADHHYQLQQVYSVILQYMSQLKRIYHYYSSLGSQSLQSSHCLTRLQFWQLLRDCRVHHRGLSIWEADTIAAQQPPCPTSCLLMREFLQSLVLLSHHLYSSTICGDVSACLSHFLTNLILPNACSLTGTVFTSISSSLVSPQQVDQCWDLYQSMATSTVNEGAMFVTMRSLLWRFKERGVVPSLIPAEVVVQALVQDQPLAVDQTDYNLDIKMTVLDVLETVSRCGQVISCEQSHDQVCESDKLSAAISQVLSKLIDNSE
ncbi:Radial spoke head 10 homolog B [Geodia barretti]|uniref:Radial spoke head 10 homolog B n=1 Tax=Geodia barretti TaxID=519541 RepID=A0AA35WLB3_GEOBA|nr:Radial spoke head 10 homolog B [Geodia barretti]